MKQGLQWKHWQVNKMTSRRPEKKKHAVKMHLNQGLSQLFVWGGKNQLIVPIFECRDGGIKWGLLLYYGLL